MAWASASDVVFTMVVTVSPPTSCLCPQRAGRSALSECLRKGYGRGPKSIKVFLTWDFVLIRPPHQKIISWSAAGCGARRSWPRRRAPGTEGRGSRLWIVDADQALLHDRDHEVARAGVDLAVCEAAGAAGEGGVLGVEEPFVGAERAVEPHGVIQAGAHRALVAPGQAVVQQE